MKKTLFSLALSILPLLSAQAQGWPAAYDGVMLQGFYWDSFVDSRWANLEAQSSEMSRFFPLIWVPQSGYCGGGNNMGYTPVYLFNQNSSFGTESELRSMIKAFRAKGTRLMADVVINHRNNLGVGGSWVDYPAEEYEGTTYHMTPADIVAGDDGGKTAAWAKSRGISLSLNADTGTDWDGCRDIDHKSANVNKNYKAYLNFLLNDLGYAGFRYDMVKGFAPQYVADYNTATKPQYSVGEYWDNSYNIKSWLKGTEVGGVPQSAAFDFQFRYAVRDAVNGGVWSRLGGSDKHPLAYEEGYKRWAITFVENHDTQYRSPSEPLDPILKDTLAANAYLLAMPGTPCVFYRHWLSCKEDIKSMINARRVAGVHAQSQHSNFATAADHYAVRVRGTKGDLVCVVGEALDKYVPASDTYVEILSGKKYRYYLSRAAQTAWVNVASGEHEAAFMVKATAVSDKAAQLVYTLDGSVPTSSSPKVGSDGRISITTSCTLHVGLLIDGSVQGVVKREYSIKPFTPHTATVYVRNENQWTPTYFYIWDSRNNTQLNGNWPGKTMSETRHVKGHDWYVQTVKIDTKGYYFNLVVGAGQNKPQTVDIPQISSDRYFVISAQTLGGKHLVQDVTNTITAIEAAPHVEVESTKPHSRFDLSGRRVMQPQSGHLYINERGQKMMQP